MSRAFTRVESVSVGYQTRLQLNAFDIEEFLWTKGLGGAVTAFFASACAGTQTLRAGRAFPPEHAFPDVCARGRNTCRRAPVSGNRLLGGGRKRAEGVP